MKLSKDQESRRTASQAVSWLVLTLAVLTGLQGRSQGVSTTTVQGTVYLANGQAGSGTVEVSWPAFTTSTNKAVASGRLSAAIAGDGFLSVRLAPNAGATPAGLFYTVVYHLSDGTTSTEYWVVPAGAQATIGQVRSQVMPAAQAIQAVSKTYVDQAIAAVQGAQIAVSGGTMSGPLLLSGDPTVPLQAADKHYVDTQVATAVPLAGGAMSGGLTTPAVNGVQSPAAGSSQTTLQSAVTAAGTSGAVLVPPGYTGASAFSNPNGVRVLDLRATGAQASERNVREFGAVCDGTTDDTSALQAALNYAYIHEVALGLPQGVCRTHKLQWHGESIGGAGKQVSGLKGYAGEDVLATTADSPSLLGHTRLHDLTIYVDVSVDVSCTGAKGRAGAGSCAVNRPVATDSILSTGGNGLTGTEGSGAAWSLGNCAIAMPAATGAGGNGLRLAVVENVTIAATGTDPLAGYTGANSTHTCGLYLAQWPQWSEFRNVEIKGLHTGVSMPALAGSVPAGLTAEANRWQNVTLEAVHGFVAAAGAQNVLDNVVVEAGNSAATAETPTGVVLDLRNGERGWSVRDTTVKAQWYAVQPTLTVTASGGAVTAVAVGIEHGLGFDPYGTQLALKFSGSCTAQAAANVQSDGTIGSVTVTQGGTGCSGTTTATVNVDGTWDTAAAVNLIAGVGTNVTGGNLQQGMGGYTVWTATDGLSAGTKFGAGGVLPGGSSSYAGLVSTGTMGVTSQVEQFGGGDFGAKLQACVNLMSTSYGGTCDARNFTGTLGMSADVRITSANTTVLLPCATIETARQIVVTAGTRNVSLRGCALRGGSQADGSVGGTAIRYTGAGAAISVGDGTYAVNTPGFQLENVVVNTTGASSATAVALAAYRTQEMKVESVYLLGNQNQTGMMLDGTGNYTGGSFYDDAISGYGIAVSGVGHKEENAATTDWLNASTFVRLHINCPTSGGNPIEGTVGIDLQQGDGNTITGGDVEGCATALHLGAGAKNNTVVGLRNENSTNQVVADAGSAYNNWMTGGTMFTGKLTDNGTRNSFLDTFHRSFNGMNGDWYGSQQDATVTNHYRLGTGAGNERGLLDRYQTDYGYRWQMGLSDATAGEQFYVVKDELNNVNRISVGQYNADQSSTNHQTVINSAGTGAVVLNGSTNSGTGGLVVGAGGTSGAPVATVSNAGNAQFNGTLQVGGTSTFSGSATMRNNADAEIDYFLWAGATANQKESVIYKDYTGASQWYLVKDASNNWALNSAIGGVDALKAYQSTNSGDTYLNAAKTSGVVRVNYETGSGTAFNVYGGNSSTLYASFAGTSAIKFPGLAAASGHSCVQVDSSGWFSNTGSPCGSGTGGSGTVAYGTLGQLAYYTDNGTQVAGISTVPVSAGGTGATTAASALTNLGAVATSGGTLTGTLTAPGFVGTGSAPQFAGTATHAQNLPVDFATQSEANPQAGTFTTLSTTVKIVDWKDASQSCTSYRGRINILDCGGDKTNNSDNTDAIRLALSRATKEEEIYFPAGSYRVDGDIALPEMNKKVVIVGESRGVGGRRNQSEGGSIIRYTGSGTLFQSDDPGNVSVSGTQDAYMLSLEVRDIAFRSSTVSTTSIAFNLDGMNHVNISRVRIKGFYKGIVGVTVAGRASYSWYLDDVNFRSYGTEAYPNAEYGMYHLMDTAIQIGAYGGNPLWAGHYTFNKVHVEQVRAGMVLTQISNLTTTNFTVDTSCSAIEGYGVEYSTFINSYLDSNPQNDGSVNSYRNPDGEELGNPYPNCGTHTAGRRITLVGGQGNVIWPTQCDGCGANQSNPDMIQPETTTVISPSGSEGSGTITRLSGAALKLGDSMNLYVSGGKGVKSYLPGLITLTSSSYTSIQGKSITIMAPNTLNVGDWVAFSAIDSPSWLRTYYYYTVLAASTSGFTLNVPYAADGTSGVANGSAYYDGTKISLLRTADSGAIVLGDYDNRLPVNVLSSAINLDAASVNSLGPMSVTTSSGTPLTITSTSTDNVSSTSQCSGIASGKYCGWWLGRANSTKNTYYTRFNYASDGSSGNNVSSGFYGGSDLTALFASGNMFVGSSPVDNGYKLEVNGSGKYAGALLVSTSSITPFAVTSTAASNVGSVANFICSGITTGQYCGGWLGQSLATKNSYYTRFHYQASGSSTNYVSGGFYSGSDLWAIFASGNMFVGSSPADNGYKLEVNGSAKIGGALTATSGTVVNYTASWTPGAVSASTCAEQTVSVSGLVTTRAVTVSSPSALSHVWIGSARASASGTLAVQFCADSTGGTPASGNWLVTQ